MSRVLSVPTAMALALSCLLLAVAVPCLADGVTAPGAETVTVAAQKALPGIWRFPPHERQSVWTSKGADFFVMGPQMYCRVGLVAAGYAFDCLELAERSAAAKLDAGSNGRVVLSWKFMWGAPSCHWSFAGKLQSDTEISGHLGSTCTVYAHEQTRWNRALVTITKLVLSARNGDAGGQSAFLKHLLEEMAAGPIAEPYVPPHFISSDPDVVPLPPEAQQKLLAFLPPENLRPLGKISTVVYVGDYFPIVGWWGRLHRSLGQDHKPNSPVYGDKRPVYAVEFEHGERLCTLHRRADGVLDQFQCL